MDMKITFSGDWNLMFRLCKFSFFSSSCWLQIYKSITSPSVRPSFLACLLAYYSLFSFHFSWWGCSSNGVRRSAQPRLILQMFSVMFVFLLACVVNVRCCKCKLAYVVQYRTKFHRTVLENPLKTCSWQIQPPLRSVHAMMTCLGTYTYHQARNYWNLD